MGLEVFNPFAGLLGDKTRQDSWRWGTVVATSPLRVQLDGDTTPLLIPPDSLVAVLTGDRVRVHVHNRRATIMGRMGGPVIPTPGPNMLPGFPIMNGLRPPGTNDFRFNANDPSLVLQGESTGWIWAQVPITEGERYRFSVDVRATVSGTVFYIQTRNAGPGGTEGEGFDSWTGWEWSASTTGASWAYPFQNVTHSQVSWRSYWSEATATMSGAVSLKIYANHSNGVANEGGHQWFRDLSIMHLPQ